MKNKLLLFLASVFLLVSCATVTPEPSEQPVFVPDRKETAVKEIRENKGKNADTIELTRLQALLKYYQKTKGAKAK